MCARRSHLTMDRDRRGVSGDFGIVRFVGSWKSSSVGVVSGRGEASSISLRVVVFTFDRGCGLAGGSLDLTELVYHNSPRIMIGECREMVAALDLLGWATEEREREEEDGERRRLALLLARDWLHWESGRCKQWHFSSSLTTYCRWCGP